MSKQSTASHPGSRLVIWGTFDKGKPRNRILVEAVSRIDPDFIECHNNIWEDVEDKSQIKSHAKLFSYALSIAMAWPALIFKLWRTPRNSIVIVPYLGLFDLFVVWPWCKMRGMKIVWDMFISLYDTVVVDRKLLKAHSLAARALYYLEWLGCRLSDQITLDTKAHAAYVQNLFRLQDDKVAHFWVGAETEIFHRLAPPEEPSHPLNVLFYGQFIPLHGIPVIVEAARMLEERGRTDLSITIVGKGQMSEQIDAQLDVLGLEIIKRIEWVDYKQLPRMVAEADITLGVFAADGKALRVIPNKVFQILAMGRPLITADSPAMREIVDRDHPGVHLIRAGDPEELAVTLAEISDDFKDKSLYQRMNMAENFPIVGVSAVEKQLRELLKPLMN